MKKRIQKGSAGNRFARNKRTEAQKPNKTGHMKSVPVNSRYMTGDFSVYSPKKYIGTFPIVYRSSYEFEFMRKLEMNATVASWNSENIIIPYKMKEGDKIVTKNYYMDFYVLSKTGKKYIVEVKPETKTPKTKAEIFRNDENYMNACKWKAALNWAKKNGYIFRIVGESQLKKFMNFN